MANVSGLNKRNMAKTFWDKYEVALLIESCLRIRAGEVIRATALYSLSEKLRRMATNKGLDSTFTVAISHYNNFVSLCATDNQKKVLKVTLLLAALQSINGADSRNGVRLTLSIMQKKGMN